MGPDEEVIVAGRERDDGCDADGNHDCCEFCPVNLEQFLKPFSRREISGDFEDIQDLIVDYLVLFNLENSAEWQQPGLDNC